MGLDMTDSTDVLLTEGQDTLFEFSDVRQPHPENFATWLWRTSLEAGARHE